jgi:tetratricopeptide (TPR) repeat protein/predicted Ser/Thr protein kinase
MPADDPREPYTIPEPLCPAQPDTTPGVGDRPAPPGADTTAAHVPSPAGTVVQHGMPSILRGPGWPEVPGYEVTGEIAKGGMGVVYAARDLTLNREVAVKTVLPHLAGDPRFAAEFDREAKLTALLSHPGVPPVHALGRLADGRPFLAMRLIRGRTLADELAAADLVADRPRLLGVFEQVAQTVGYAHAKKIAHRDLKPANVMVGAFGEVQVMDWGLAKVLGGAIDSPAAPRGVAVDPGATVAGEAKGTPAYMPPEQARGEWDTVDARADVFALGGILCAVLTGHPPYGGDTVTEVVGRAAAGDVADGLARVDRCGADAELVGLCRRCLAPTPADRPADAKAVAESVATYRSEVEKHARRAETERAAAKAEAREQRKRRRAVQWAAGVAAAVLLAGIAGTTVGLIRADRARTDADNARREADARRVTAEAARAAEAEQREKAEAARAEAVRKEEEAEAVVKFFERRVLAAARPRGQERGLGHDVTLRDVLAAAVPALDGGFEGHPLVEARLRMTLSRTFATLGDDRAATEQLELARALLVEHRGPDHPATLLCVRLLASRYLAGDRKAEGLGLLEGALAAYRRAAGPDDPATLDCVHALANGYAAAGRHADAARAHEAVLAARRRALPPGHGHTLDSAQALADSLAELGRHPEALALREEALEGLQRVLPRDHPDTLRAMHHLAYSYDAVGRPADALRLRERALAGRRRVLPADHPDLRHSLLALAASYAAAGRPAEALGLHEEVLAGRRRAHPAGHPAVLEAVAEVAAGCAALGRWGDALRHWEEALAAHRQGHPANHPGPLAALRGVAEALVGLGRGAEAVGRIDAGVGAAGRDGDPELVRAVLDVRLRHFQRAGDPAGCRATAETWEKQNRPDSASVYAAARYRAAAATVYDKNGQPADAAADADRAMAWLAKAVAAGLRDRALLEAADLEFLRGRADFRELVAALPYLAPPPREVRP